MASITLSQYGKYMELQNVSGSGDPADAPEGGIYLFASGTSAAPNTARLYMQNEGGTVTDVMKTLDIDAFDALGGAGLHQTQDHFVFSDNGTEKKITFSNLQDAVFADVSGDATIAAGGALTIAAQAVENSMLADDAVGADELAANAVVNASIASNAAIDMDKLDGGSLASSLSDLAQGDLMYAGDVDDSNNIKSITFSNLEDAIFGNVSGDATIAAGGALTIAAGAVENSMLADDAVGADELAANAVVEASIVDNAVTLAKMAGITRGSLILGDASGDPSLLGKGTAAQFLQSDGTDPSYVSISGDATVAAGGALTVAAGAIEHGMLNDNIISGQANLGGVGVDDADEFMFSDAGTVKALTGANLYGWVFGKVSGDATVAAGGALTIGTGVVEHAMLAADCVDGDNIGDDVVNSEHIALGALDAEHFSSGSIQTGHVADNQVTLAKMAGLASAKFILGNSDGDPAAVTMSGDATLSNAGALTIAAGAVEHGMLAEDIISGQAALGGASVAQADLLMLDDGPGTVKKVTFSNFEDSIFGNVSGDATIAAGGALTIAAQAVENSMLADDAVGADELAANAVVNASVASNAAIEGTKLNLNVDFGGNFAIGNQSDDVCQFGGILKVGGNSILDSGNNGAITFDGSGNTQAAGALTVGTDGGGKQFTVHGASANEFMRYIPGDNLLKFQNGSSATVLTLGGDATSEYALDVTNGSDNINKVRAAAFVTYSDESLKQDVATMNTALDTVMSLNGVEFTWKDSGERDFGFIAQDVQSVLPKAVHTADDGVQGVDYSRLTSVLVEAVKAQQVQIEELKALLKK